MKKWPFIVTLICLAIQCVMTYPLEDHKVNTSANALIVLYDKIKMRIDEAAKWSLDEHKKPLVEAVRGLKALNMTSPDPIISYLLEMLRNVDEDKFVHELFAARDAISHAVHTPADLLSIEGRSVKALARQVQILAEKYFMKPDPHWTRELVEDIDDSIKLLKETDKKELAPWLFMVEKLRKEKDIDEQEKLALSIFHQLTTNIPLSSHMSHI